MKQTFEQFLMEKHAKYYTGAKDSMVDDFADLIANLSSDEFMECGDQFAKEQSKELLECLKEGITKMLLASPDEMKKYEQAIAETEEAK